jgi:hypothetical protein
MKTRYVKFVRFLGEEWSSEDNEWRVGSSRCLSINRDGRNGGGQDDFIRVRSALQAREVVNRVRTLPIQREQSEGRVRGMPGSVRRLCRVSRCVWRER